MKFITGILITLTAWAAQAQLNQCNMITIEKQATQFLIAMSVFETRHIQPCLEIAIEKQLISSKVSTRNFINERFAVLDILAEIKQTKTAAQVKCESSETPGCLAGTDAQSLEDSELETDADQKRFDVELRRENSSQDW